jgi:hypothetical protein
MAEVALSKELVGRAWLEDFVPAMLGQRKSG